jgi:hypothetical protein
MTSTCQPQQKAKRKLVGFLSVFTLVSGVLLTIMWVGFLGWVLGRVALGIL